jgi:hypothetical protein
MNFYLLLQLTILAALKLTRPGPKPKTSFLLRARARVEHWSKLSVVAAHAIPRKLYAIKDTRHAHAARCPKIRGSHRQNLSCNKKKKNHGLRSKLLQLFYFSCLNKTNPHS